MPRIHTSRRVPPLKDSDYDHEIALVDDSPSDSPSDSDARTHESAGESALDALGFAQPQPESRPEAQQEAEPEPELELEAEQEPEASTSRQVSAEVPSTVPIFNKIPPTPTATMDPNGANNGVKRSPSKQSRQRSKRASNESQESADSAIDILYENERGGFLCGLPLFSSKALGNLDPAPWTNAGHKPSLTNTKTATVPDPSWEWAWPDWKVNRDVGVDKDGWEYSFMFSKKFSWHGPKWWNSFVRRRAWIRRRIRRRHRESCDAHSSDDPCLLNPDYFTVQPASQSTRSRSSSIASRVSRMGSVRGSRSSLGHSRTGSVASVGSAANVEEVPDIVNVDVLLAVLKLSRIDREKIEAVENYLKHSGDDLVRLQESMHDIMRLFVFQSSRQILLTRLMQVYDQTKAQQAKDDSPRLEQRAKHLSAAIKHGDEEVRKLEYWSDIKGMAERGESGGAVDGDKGWDDRFKGLDNSGPAPTLKPKPGDREGLSHK